MAAFDAALFTGGDAADAQLQNLGWCDAISKSVLRRQAEFFFGRWVARTALLEGGLPCVAVPRDTSGAPLWPPSTVGSITHIDGLAAAAIASRSSHRYMGLDLERLAVGENQHALRRLVIDQDELQLLEALDARELDLWVTLAFSAKESFYKAAYPSVGRFFDFTAVRIVSVDLSAGQMLLEIVEPLTSVFSVGSRWLIDFDVIHGDVVFTAFTD